MYLVAWSSKSDYEPFSRVIRDYQPPVRKLTDDSRHACIFLGANQPQHILLSVCPSVLSIFQLAHGALVIIHF